MKADQFSEHDLSIAAKLGEISAAIESLHTKVDGIKYEKINEHQAIWTQIEKIKDKQHETHGSIRWIIGIGIGLQAAWAGLLAWMKHN